ncbi:AP-2 complex subunit alpha-1 [Striga hermonthica]|uniref:AP-2 complex subunit alpha-1 n=1 Tax=Striga hermonthica TaxID=68872 RepID=A0A9N7RJZ8_STRHE|nr:AP-2 complex subunit alpha-1 [Striga hermonthica]
MTRMLMVTDVHEIIKRHQAQIITSLKDPDISIRRRALDLLYGMCDISNAKDIVEEFLHYLSSVDFAMLEELSLKAAMLAEKFAPDLSWYESCINAEIQQRAVECHALSLKGAALMDILVEMPKFSERKSSLIKKVEDSEADTAEQSATKLWAQQQNSSALVVSYQRPANGAAPVSQLGLVKVPTGLANANGALTVVDPKPPSTPSPDLLGDLLGPLAIEGPLGIAPHSEPRAASGLQVGANQDALAIAPVEEQAYTVQPIGDIAESFHALKLKDSGVQYEDPYIQGQSRLPHYGSIGVKSEWQAHHGRVVLFLGNKNTAPLVSVQALILPPSHLKMELSLVPETIPPRAQVEGPLGTAPQSELRAASGLQVGANQDALAIAPVEEQAYTVQPIGDIAESFHALKLKDSGVLYEDPYIQGQSRLSHYGSVFCSLHDTSF